jgi:hypothetical protein
MSAHSTTLAALLNAANGPSIITCHSTAQPTANTAALGVAFACVCTESMHDRCHACTGHRKGSQVLHGLCWPGLVNHGWKVLCLLMPHAFEGTADLFFGHFLHRNFLRLMLAYQNI